MPTLPLESMRMRSLLKSLNVKTEVPTALFELYFKFKLPLSQLIEDRPVPSESCIKIDGAVELKCNNAVGEVVPRPKDSAELSQKNFAVVPVSSYSDTSPLVAN